MFNPFTYFKEKMEAKERAEALERKRLLEEAEKKRVEAEKKRVEESKIRRESYRSNPYAYDDAYKKCHTQEDFSNFYYDIAHDTEFWGFDPATLFTKDGEQCVRNLAGYCLIEYRPDEWKKDAPMFGVNKKNPLIDFLIYFGENRESEEQKIAYKPNHDYGLECFIIHMIQRSPNFPADENERFSFYKKAFEVAKTIDLNAWSCEDFDQSKRNFMPAMIKAGFIPKPAFGEFSDIEV